MQKGKVNVHKINVREFRGEREHCKSWSSWGRFLEELMFEHDFEGWVGLNCSIEDERYSRQGG